MRTEDMNDTMGSKREGGMEDRVENEKESK
jgi:hypothetical protein